MEELAPLTEGEKHQMKWDDFIARQTGERTWTITRPLAPGWLITETLARRCAENDWVRTCDVTGTDMDSAGKMHASSCVGYIYPVTERYAAAWLDMYFPDSTPARETDSEEQALEQPKVQNIE